MKKEKPENFIGEYNKGEILFIDNFEEAKLVDYLSYLRLTGKHNYLEDNTGMSIAQDLYKVDNKPNVFQKSVMEQVTISEQELQKLLFILLVNKNKFTINGVIGNYDEADDNPTLQALKELEERGVYATNRAEAQAFYSEYDNKFFFTNIFTNDGELTRLDSMFDEYYKGIIMAVGLLFRKEFKERKYDKAVKVYKILKILFNEETNAIKKKDKFLNLESRMMAYFYKDKYIVDEAENKMVERPKPGALHALTRKFEEETQNKIDILIKEDNEELEAKAKAKAARTEAAAATGPGPAATAGPAAAATAGPATIR